MADQKASRRRLRNEAVACVLWIIDLSISAELTNPSQLTYQWLLPPEQWVLKHRGQQWCRSSLASSSCNPGSWVIKIEALSSDIGVILRIAFDLRIRSEKDFLRLVNQANEDDWRCCKSDTRRTWKLKSGSRSRSTDPWHIKLYFASSSSSTTPSFSIHQIRETISRASAWPLFNWCDVSLKACKKWKTSFPWITPERRSLIKLQLGEDVLSLLASWFASRLASLSASLHFLWSFISSG